MENLLKVKQLKKYFDTPGGTLHAVDDINFSLAAGETLGVVGESGCGKSTLGRVVLHLLESTSGQIWFEGKDITHVSRSELRELRKKMQIIFQDPYASVDEPLRNNGMKSRSEREEKVAELMELIGLAKRFTDYYPHELDGGRRQRAVIARALATNPRFIVCDEPVSALDVSIQAQVINLIMELQEKLRLTYMFISHDLSVVKYVSTHIMVMYLGQTVEYAETGDLFAHPVHPYTQALLSAVPIPKLGAQKQRILLKGEITSPIDPKPGCRFAPRCPRACEQCHQEIPALREVADGHMVACHMV